MEKIRLKQAVIVEGKYDKMRLESILDALIIPTHGFSIFTDDETKRFIKATANQRGLILLTDSDTAGFKIRGFLQGLVPQEQITNVYIPDIFGKERRKRVGSKEGTLGVEGMNTEILKKAFESAGVTSAQTKVPPQHITKSDLYEDGFYGGENSAVLRNLLYKELGLPKHISTKSAVNVLCGILTRDDYLDLVAKIKKEYNHTT